MCRAGMNDKDLPLKCIPVTRFQAPAYLGEVEHAGVVRFCVTTDKALVIIIVRDTMAGPIKVEQVRLAGLNVFSKLGLSRDFLMASVTASQTRTPSSLLPQPGVGVAKNRILPSGTP